MMTCTLLLAVPIVFTSGEAKVNWDGKAYGVESLPETLAPSTREAIETWGEWSAERGYRLDLEKEGRVLLISDGTDGRTRTTMKLVTRTIRAFDKLVPKRDPSWAPEKKDEPGKEEPKHDPIPEDPDDDRPWLDGGSEKAGEEEWYVEWEWGKSKWPLDTETSVLFVFKEGEHYAEALDVMSESHPYLAEWKEEALGFSGFVVPAPLTGGFRLDDPTNEEWNPDNELVNRLARLLLVRRYGIQPNWIAQGIAWQVEMKVQKGIYCFPGRTGFVWATEHGGWDKQLASTYKKREGAVQIEDFASLKSGEYDADQARAAWGAIGHLGAKHSKVFGAILEDLRSFRDVHGRVELGDNRWERDRDYEVPLDDQVRILTQHAGAKFFKQLGTAFRKGKVH